MIVNSIVRTELNADVSWLGVEEDRDGRLFTREGMFLQRASRAVTCAVLVEATTSQATWWHHVVGRSEREKI